MPVYRQCSLVGVETRHTTLARENRDAASLMAGVRQTDRISALSQNIKGNLMTTLFLASQAVQFSFNSSTIRTIAENGEIWFVAKDVASCAWIYRNFYFSNRNTF